MRSTVRYAVILIVLQTAGAAMALAGEVVTVKIADLAFAPAVISARVGDTVEWVNGDFIDHTATAKSGDWDVVVPVGTTSRLELTHAGAVEYFCRFHPNMTGTITVAPE